jgi:hypothetical protein
LEFLKQVGFDLRETVEQFGRKTWRVCRLTESASGKGTVAEKYALIRDSLGDLHDVALIVGDTGLAESLKRIQEWVEGKCRNGKAKPR